MEINKIYTGDCLEKLKDIPDSSVDAIVTDPPYELGFMGKSWDNTGIANNIDMWKECLRVLKPGGHLLSFGGTRTYHRMASAIEDAGFEIRDMVEWVYGSGFPKSLNIGKAVAKLQGNEREVTGYQEREGRSSGILGKKVQITRELTQGTSEWEGWGTALKPAHEPICMARKPLGEKTVAENCLKWGTGGINIDESRVGTEGARFNGRNVDSDIYGKYGTDKPKEVYNYGRFPANLIHDNSEEVRECFPETKSGSGDRNSKGKTELFTGFGDTGIERPFEANSGNASRFFKSIIYTAKASKSERDKGCENMPEVEKGTMDDDNYQWRDDVPNGRSTSKPMGRNFHPTVKPIALMEYLINMVTREGQAVLDPFAGSGTTLIAVKKLGRNYIGIELNPEYVKIAESRLRATTPPLFTQQSLDKGDKGKQ